MALKHKRLLLLQERRKPKPTTPGNAAALRDALISVKALIDDEPDGTPMIDAMKETVDAALAEPPRNCDRFATAYDALKEWHGGLETAEDIARMAEWLLAPAQEGVAE